MATSPNQTGSVKNAWPEYRGQHVDKVKSGLEASGQNSDDISVWGPGPESPPLIPGTDKSIWLYTTFADIVYHIPVRGKWHENRAGAGWPDLVGVKAEDAITQIFAEVIGITIVYGPTGFPRTEDLRWDRVFLDVGKDGNVELTPKIG
eukprot:TRINITY_DN10_c0_g4_i1.p1 TRINITY_DN10_c0_g4~~TRINITY_DN10_c0_g4_i1.p1  ORF type:complete len:148 (+),score=6.68 TRINITY_DN10_c0_g4_i1:243-686(+)